MRSPMKYSNEFRKPQDKKSWLISQILRKKKNSSSQQQNVSKNKRAKTLLECSGKRGPKSNSSTVRRVLL